MELRHLRYFVAVAEEENVSRAASKLHVSQPGISRQIHDLEDEIGFLLFERSGKSVRLTAAGKIFFGEARDILQRAADAVKKARAGLASRAEINVGYAPSATVEILPRALRAFSGSFPGVRVILHDLSAKRLLADWVIARPPWNKMNVTVHHSLTGNLSAVDSNVKAHHSRIRCRFQLIRRPSRFRPDFFQ
jgi:DNA-binding transcriptional LysR family regulator